MKDVNGNELQVGDFVVYTGKTLGIAKLRLGHIKSFYLNEYKREECTVDSCTHVSSNRIMKVATIKEG